MERNGQGAKKRKKAEQLNANRNQVAQSFEATGVQKTKRQKYKVSFESMAKIFHSLIDLVALKLRSMNTLAFDVRANDEFLVEMKVRKDPKRIAELVDRIAEENVIQHEMLAFKTPSGKTN